MWETTWLAGQLGTCMGKEFHKKKSGAFRNWSEFFFFFFESVRTAPRNGMNELRAESESLRV